MWIILWIGSSLLLIGCQQKTDLQTKSENQPSQPVTAILPPAPSAPKAVYLGRQPTTKAVRTVQRLLFVERCGAYLIASSEDKKLHLWLGQNQKQVELALPHRPGPMCCVANQELWFLSASVIVRLDLKSLRILNHRKGPYHRPRDLAQLSDGTLLVLEKGPPVQLVLESADGTRRTLDVAPDANAVAAIPTGGFFVLQGRQKTVLQYRSNGQIVRFLKPKSGLDDWGAPVDLVSQNDHLFVVDARRSLVFEIDYQANTIARYGEKRPGLRMLALPTSIAVDPTGFWVASRRGQELRRYEFVSLSAR